MAEAPAGHVSASGGVTAVARTAGSGLSQPGGRWPRRSPWPSAGYGESLTSSARGPRALRDAIHDHRKRPGAGAHGQRARPGRDAVRHGDRRAAPFAILDRYVAAGGSFIDTSNGYPFLVNGTQGGESEALPGRWRASRGIGDEVVIATKAGARPVASAAGFDTRAKVCHVRRSGRPASAAGNASAGVRLLSRTRTNHGT
jgi:hypothetical protein